jgi:DHA1 family bicyclomycin/chloramphenicol resistance-like MFS transporter
MGIRERAGPAPEGGPVMSEARVGLIGALLTAIGPVSMALYTPAMTETVHAFGTTEALVKLTLTLYFGGFACAQLVAGPLSDALGRRPVTFAFMGIYCAGSLAALWAPNVGALMAARFVQGVGASAGVAISRAVVRDIFQGQQSSRIMNLIGIILAVGPAAAPTIGGLVLMAAGWRAIFVVMACLGLTVVAVTSVWLRETIVPDPSRLKPRVLAAAYGEILASRHFLVTAGIVAGAVGALYAQATFLSFILMERVGLTPAEFGVGMLFQSGSYLVGSLVVRSLMRRTSAYRLVGPGLVFIGIGSAGVALLLVWEPSFLRVMAPVAFFAFGIAFVNPGMTTAALAPFPRIAGAASSMMGFIQMGSGLAVGSLGALLGNPVLAMGALIPAMGVVACLLYRIYRRHPHLAEPEPVPTIAGLPVGRTMMPRTPAVAADENAGRAALRERAPRDLSLLEKGCR